MGLSREKADVPDVTLDSEPRSTLSIHSPPRRPRMSTTRPFTTPTGQTGPDAYAFELAQIANEMRDLDARMARLVTAMSTELPETATYRMPMASKQFPDHAVTADITTIRKQLEMCQGVDSFTLEFIRTILKTLDI